jgi:hypothetical protein
MHRSGPGLDDRTLLHYLEEVASAIGLDIRYERLEGEASAFPGGLCRIRTKTVLILNSQGTPRKKGMAIARALRRFDLSRVYVRPAVREILDADKENGEWS